MPGAVPHTSTLALTNATFPYVMNLAQHGAREAILRDDGIRDGVNTYEETSPAKPSQRHRSGPWKPVRDLLAHTSIPSARLRLNLSPHSYSISVMQIRHLSANPKR